MIWIIILMFVHVFFMNTSFIEKLTFPIQFFLKENRIIFLLLFFYLIIVKEDFVRIFWLRFYVIVFWYGKIVIIKNQRFENKEEIKSFVRKYM